MAKTSIMLALVCLLAGFAAADTTVTFQQGTAGYTGAADTWIQSTAADNDNGASDQIQLNSGTVRQGLLRFSNIIGPGLIPAGAIINSATLTVCGYDGSSAGGGAVHRLLSTATTDAWTESSTWNTMVGGISGAEYEATATASFASAPKNGTPVELNVKADVEAWAGGAANCGWVIMGTGTTQYLRSSNFATVSQRPLLTVSYLPPGLFVTSFTVKDHTSQSTAFTDSRTVDVAVSATVPEGDTIDGYMITEAPGQPEATAEGWLGSVASYEITGPEGSVTLYAWVKDNHDNVAGRTATIIYYPAAPVVSDVVITPTGSNAANVTWTTDFETCGSVKFRKSGTVTWFTTAAETTPTLTHSVQMTDLVFNTTYDVVVVNYGVEEPAQTFGYFKDTPAIPRTAWTATASSNAGSAGNAIDDNTGTGWQPVTHNPTNEWLRVDLGARYNVQLLRNYQPSDGSWWIIGYEIYLTDSESLLMADWGTAVAAGNWTTSTGWKDTALTPKDGRFLIFRITNGTYNGNIRDISLYGTAATGITGFTVADSDGYDGCALFTTSTTVNVTKFDTVVGSGKSITGYKVTDSADAPTSWDLAAPTTGTFAAGGAGDVTLYAWIQEDTGLTISRSYRMLYNPDAPVASDITVTTTAIDATTVTWTTDSEAYGRIRYRTGEGEWTITAWEAAHSTSHTVKITGLALNTTYEVVVQSNDRLETAVSYAHLLGVSALSKTLMTAVASHEPPFAGSSAPARALDGSTSTGWYPDIHPPTNEWIKVDLTARFSVKAVRLYQPADGSWAVNGYRIYVTDSPSVTPGDWGSPVATGTVDSAAGNKDVIIPATNGRYLIWYITSATGSNGQIMELYFWGSECTAITAFNIADTDGLDGNTIFTDSTTVDVTAFTTTGVITGYQITDEDVEPTAWLGIPPDTASFTAAEAGDVTLYAWVQDETGECVSRSYTIFYNPAEPAATDITVTPLAADKATVTWTTDSDAFGRAKWDTSGVTAWEAAHTTTHSRVITGLALGGTYDVVVQSNDKDADAVSYTHLAGISMIPKGQMSVVSASTNLAGAPNVLDGNNNSGWYAVPDDQHHYPTAGWIKIDLGARYNMQMFRMYQSGDGSWLMLGYKLYITDSTSLDEADWGDAVAVGTFDRAAGNKDVVFAPTNGRYLCYRITSSEYNASLMEIWAWGGECTSVTSFTVADTDGLDGSTRFTDSTTVAVTSFTTGGNVVNCQITQSADVPTSGWLGAAPDTFTFTAAEAGNITLYAWVKDTNDECVSKSTSILYNPAAPAVSNVQIAPASVPTATVSWTTSTPTYGKVYWRQAGLDPVPDWSATAWEATFGTSHAMTITNLALDSSYEVMIQNNDWQQSPVTYDHLIGVFALDKGAMTADASTHPEEAPRTIDGDGSHWATSWSPPGWTPEVHFVKDEWLRYDLGASYDVRVFSLMQSSDDSWHMYGYRIFVTDSTSPLMENWGAPVAQGSFPATSADTKVDVITTPKVGRYVVYYIDSSSYNGNVKEIYIYGKELGVDVESFAVKDQSTGSTAFTNLATVNVELVPIVTGSVTVTGYLITESATEPTEGWLEECPSLYTIAAAPDADVTIYAWVKGSDGTVGSKVATIYYGTAQPVASNILVTAGAPGTATVTWSTTFATYGSARVKPASGGDWTTFTEAGPRTDTHNVQISGLLDGVVYQVAVVNNEKVEPAVFFPQGWPIEGDANMDCRVNILDLIFIRNRLNADPATGDNWQADVNMDTRINILDLIYVRNRLNNACP